MVQKVQKNKGGAGSGASKGQENKLDCD